MILGIVGSEGAKFTLETEAKAREEIRELITYYQPELVVSGECHLGGIDIWTREEATAMGVPFKGYKPEQLRWDAPYGYKKRNLDIAKSDVVACITVKELPASYKGMKFSGCYHCKGRNPDHVKSGGCWTAWQAPVQVWRIIE